MRTICFLAVVAFVYGRADEETIGITVDEATVTGSSVNQYIGADEGAYAQVDCQAMPKSMTKAYSELASGLAGSQMDLLNALMRVSHEKDFPQKLGAALATGLAKGIKTGVKKKAEHFAEKEVAKFLAHLGVDVATDLADFWNPVQWVLIAIQAGHVISDIVSLGSDETDPVTFRGSGQPLELGTPQITFTIKPTDDLPLLCTVRIFIKKSFGKDPLLGEVIVQPFSPSPAFMQMQQKDGSLKGAANVTSLKLQTQAISQDCGLVTSDSDCFWCSSRMQVVDWDSNDVSCPLVPISFAVDHSAPLHGLYTMEADLCNTQRACCVNHVLLLESGEPNVYMATVLYSGICFSYLDVEIVEFTNSRTAQFNRDMRFVRTAKGLKVTSVAAPATNTFGPHTPLAEATTKAEPTMDVEVDLQVDGAQTHQDAKQANQMGPNVAVVALAVSLTTAALLIVAVAAVVYRRRIRRGHTAVPLHELTEDVFIEVAT